jgi:hypothetical protein
MFVSHYGPSFAGKAAKASVSLWVWLSLCSCLIVKRLVHTRGSGDSIAQTGSNPT